MSIIKILNFLNHLIKLSQHYQKSTFHCNNFMMSNPQGNLLISSYTPRILIVRHILLWIPILMMIYVFYQENLLFNGMPYIHYGSSGLVIGSLINLAMRLGLFPSFENREYIRLPIVSNIPLLINWGLIIGTFLYSYLYGEYSHSMLMMTYCILCTNMMVHFYYFMLHLIFHEKKF